jgi:isochorismate pyruvate lyase
LGYSLFLVSSDYAMFCCFANGFRQTATSKVLTNFSTLPHAEPKRAAMSVEQDKKTPVDPALCETMAEVRVGVDSIDQQLVALLAQRFAYMDAAARIKNERATVRDEQRKAEVIANVRRAALDQRIPQDLVTQLWDMLVEGSISYEFDRWDSLRTPG